MASDQAKDAPESKEGGFWQESSRPLTALVFILPLLAIYEIGMIAIGRESLRNGADALLRRFLDLLGFSQYFLLPLLTCSILLAWHHLTGRPWKIQWRVLPFMLAETALLAILLIGLFRVFTWLMPAAIALDLSATQLQAFFAKMVLYMGAGIYEELLFRLILLMGLAGIARLVGVSAWWSYVLAGAMSAILFSLAHHLPGGETFDWNSRTSWRNFAFRTAAGIFFAVLFLYRGFGIAAATHALYDVCTEFDSAG